MCDAIAGRIGGLCWCLYTHVSTISWLVQRESCVSLWANEWVRANQASQWAGPGFKFLSLAHTWPKPWWARPDPKKPGPAQSAEIVQEQGLSQFYLKMPIILTLAVE